MNNLIYRICWYFGILKIYQGWSLSASTLVLYIHKKFIRNLHFQKLSEGMQVSDRIYALHAETPTF